MRKICPFVLVLALACVMCFSCAVTPSSGSHAANDTPATGSLDGEKEKVNLWSYTDEIPTMTEKFLELNPDIADKYDFEITIIATTEGAYQPALDQALAEGGVNAPDIYAAEAAFVLKYTQGDMAEYAIPYKSLGIDVDRLLAESGIAPYTVDIGTRGGGDLVGLGYQATGSAMIYRRSIAIDVWGTDDPDIIKSKTGPGWEKFFEAAGELRDKGYAIVSGDGDIWHGIENNADQGWIVDGKLYIDPGREVFLDYSKRLKDNDWHNDTEDWQPDWFNDIAGVGPKPVFAFFGPAWLINYVMGGNAGDTFGDWAVCEPPVGFYWGGTWLLANKDTTKKDAVSRFIEWVTLDSTDTGLQYYWANGTLYGDGGTKDTVGSGVVMERSNGEIDFLGGQNMFNVFVPAAMFANGKNMTQYDESINQIWREETREYSDGAKTREEAIQSFRQRVEDTLGIRS